MKSLASASLWLALFSTSLLADNAVTETAQEFQATGDLNGDGLADVVVVDKATGQSRIGIALPSGAHQWQTPVSTGVDQPTGMTIGRILQSDRAAYILTSPATNRVQVLEYSDTVITQPSSISVGGIGPSSLAALEIGRANANPALDDLAVASLWSGASTPNRLDLVRNEGDRVYSPLFNTATPTTDDIMSQLKPLRVSRNPAIKPMLAMIRESNFGTRFTLSQVFSGEVDLALPTVSRTGIANGHHYVSGFFGTTNNVSPTPHVIFYGANQTQTTSHYLQYGGDPEVYFFTVGQPQIINYPNSVKSITVIPRAAPLADRLLVLFATGPQRAVLYDYDGVNFPTVVQVLDVPVAGSDFNGALAMPDGTFVMLTGDVFNRSTGSHRYDADGQFIPGTASVMTPLNAFASRANILFYNIDPTISESPKLLGTFNAGDWTSQLTLAAGNTAVVKETNSGGSLGLRAPTSAMIGAPPAGTFAGRTNQEAPIPGLPEFDGAISHFSLSGARGRVVQDPVIDPPSGNYPQAIQVTITPATGTTVRYRLNTGFFAPQQDWLIYNPAFPPKLDVYQSSTLEYYAEEAGDRSPVRRAEYNFSHGGTLDSDEDGVPDPFEIAAGLDPNDGFDSDGDGASDFLELLFGTDPNNPDDLIDGFQQAAGLRNGETFQLQVTARPVNGRSVPTNLTWPLAGTRVFASDYRGNLLASGSIGPFDPLPQGMPNDSGVALLNEVPARSRFPFVSLSTQPTYQVTSKVVLSTNVVTGGSGYDPATTATVVGGNGTGAEVEPVIENGSITDIRIVRSGADYKTGTLINFQPAPSGDPALVSALIGPGPQGREFLSLLPEPATERIELNYFFPGGDVQTAMDQWLTQARAAYGIASIAISDAQPAANQIINTAVPHGFPITPEGEEANIVIVIHGLRALITNELSVFNGVHRIIKVISTTQFKVETGVLEVGTGGSFYVARAYGPQAVASTQLTHTSTLHALLVEDALAERLGIEDLTLFAGREGDEGRRVLTQEDLDRLERPGHDTGAFLATQIHASLLDGLTNENRPASVNSLLALVRSIYEVSSQRDTPTDDEAKIADLENFVEGNPADLPPVYVNPVEVIRHLLATGDVIAPYNTAEGIAGTDMTPVHAGLAYLRGLISPRPLIEIALEVPLSGHFSDCTVLREVGGFDDYALVGADGRAFPLPTEFPIVSGMKFLVQGYSDVASQCFQQNTLEVVTMRIIEYPQRSLDPGAPQPQSLAFSPPARRYLGEGTLTLFAQSSSGLPVEFSLVSGPAALFGDQLTFTGKGSVKVRATQPGNEEFLPATPILRTITVLADPAVTALTLTNLAQTYDGSPRTIGVLGATDAVIGYKVGANYVSEAPILPGKYTVRAVAGTTTKSGTLIIAKAPLFVLPDDQRKFAGQPNPALTFTYSGFVPGDTQENSVLTAPVLATKASVKSAGGLYPITASRGTSVKYAFVYQTGSMLVETFAGSYEALVRLGEEDGFSPVGKLEFTVASSGQSFSGKLSTAGETAALSIKGTVQTNPTGESAIGTGQVKKGLNTYEVEFNLPLTGPFNVSIKRNGSLIAAAANGQKRLLLAKGQKLSYTGTHTVVLTPLAEAGSPAGAGWASGVIDAKGTLKLTGRLGDGTTFTTAMAADVLTDPGYRLFVQPYKPARTDSYIAADFALKSHPDLPERRYLAFADLAQLAWVKSGLPRDASYRAGIPQIYTPFTLDPWLPPVKATRTSPAILLGQRLGLAQPDNAIHIQHSAFTSDSFANLPTALALNDLKNTASVTTPLENTTKWKVKLTPTTGLFSGSFELLDAGRKRTVPFTGVLRQTPTDDEDGILGDGVFLLPALPGAVSNEQLAGEVRFDLP